MAIVSCPECGAAISDTAAACPNCGYALDPGRVRSEPERVAPAGKAARGPSIAGPILIIVLILLVAALAAWYLGILRFAR